MAHTIRFLQLIRVGTTTKSLASVLPPRIPLKIEAFRSLMKSIESPAVRCARPLIIDWKLHVQRYFYMTKSYNVGHGFSMGRLSGVSAVLGAFFLRPHFAHCIDGYGSSVDDNSMGMLGDSETDDNPHYFMIFAKKLMVPIALLLIVWMNWNYPVALGVKVVLTLVSTKPSPFSVYVFIEQLQQQYRGQHPFLHKFKVSVFAHLPSVSVTSILKAAYVTLLDKLSSTIINDENQKGIYVICSNEISRASPCPIFLDRTTYSVMSCSTSIYFAIFLDWTTYSQSKWPPNIVQPMLSCHAQHQSILQSLYAKKVEVDDYTVFCIAKVEIGDQNYTLLGILGGWWVFEMTSLRSALSGFRTKTLEILQTVVSSDA